MPARQLRPAPLADPLDDLRQLVAGMSPPEVEAFASTLDGPDLAMLEQVVADVTGLTWREHPAAMAEHLGGVPGVAKYERWPYVDLLSRRFADGIHGLDPRQLWNIPSQYGKTTTLVTVGVPWALDFDPTLRIMYVTAEATKAWEEGGKARDFAEAHADVLRFRLRRDRRARGMWRTTEGGGLYCVGIRGQIVGWPIDVLIVDDPLKGWQEAHSESARTFVWNVYRSQGRMRMQKSTDPIFLVHTRWHEDDPTGRALAEPVDPAGLERWHLTRLPAIAEAADPRSLRPELRDPDPLGREPGEPLEPRRFPLAEVQARAHVLGSYLAAGLEQQRPAPEEGNDVKRAWWRLEDPLPPAYDEAMTSWDTKLKDSESGDYVVGQVWGRTGSDFWLLDEIRGQWSQAITHVAVALLAVRYPFVSLHLLEGAGFAPEVRQLASEANDDYVLDPELAGQLGMTEPEAIAVETMIRRGIPGVMTKRPEGDKRVRMRAVSPIIEARNVHLAPDAPWVPGYLDELSAFPNGGHDDRVDATSQALARLSHGTASVGVPQPGQGAQSRAPLAARRSMSGSRLPPGFPGRR